MEIYSQSNFHNTERFKDFAKDSKIIDKFIQSKRNEIDLLNKIGASSKKVQDFLYDNIIKSLGYSEEEKQDFFIPDFIKTHNKHSTIIEVERGKTINNNMDFIDFWKCHIHPTADVLILIVPYQVPRSNNKQMKVYSFVLKRMAPLFEKKNYTNVKALAVIPF